MLRQTLWVAVTEALLLGPVRVVSLAYIWSFNRIVSKHWAAKQLHPVNRASAEYLIMDNGTDTGRGS